MQSLAAAFKYLTIWNSFAAVQPSAETVGKGAVFFPLVGLAIGLALALSSYLLAPYLHPEVLSVALITLLIGATGGRHLDGLRRTFTAKSARQDGQDSDTLGLAALFLVILFKIAAADSMDETLALSLLLAPVLARWASVLFLYGYHSRFDDLSRLIAGQIRGWHLMLGTLATLALAVYFLGRKGLWIGLALSLLTLMTRSLLYRRHGVLKQDQLGAAVELGEVLSLILLASL